jgi:hypothetical protein
VTPNPKPNLTPFAGPAVIIPLVAGRSGGYLRIRVLTPWLGLRVGICSLGAGRVRLSRFSYRAIEETI